MRQERYQYSPRMQELFSIARSEDSSATERRKTLISNPYFLDEVLNRYWPIKEDLEGERDDSNRNLLRSSIGYRLGRLVVDTYADIAAVPARKLMQEQYGFDSDTLAQFDPQNSHDNEVLLTILFDYSAFIQGSVVHKAMGKQFNRPMRAFGGRTRIDMARSENPQDRIDLMQHFYSGLYQNAS